MLYFNSNLVATLGALSGDHHLNWYGPNSRYDADAPRIACRASRMS